MESKKDWLDYSEDEMKAKLVQIGQAIKDNDLSKELKIRDGQGVHFGLKKAGDCTVHNFLCIQGDVSLSKAGNVENLKKALNSGPLKDVSPTSYKFDVFAMPAIGEPFIPITEIVDIYSQDSKSIQHKPG